MVAHVVDVAAGGAAASNASAEGGDRDVGTATQGDLEGLVMHAA